MVLVNRYTDDIGDLYLKFFLIDSSENNREWRTTDAANEAYARTAVGTPFTLMLSKEESKFKDYHPFLPDANAPVKDQIDFAYKYAIGQIVDVNKESGRYKSAYGGEIDNPWFATVKITDPTAKEEFQKPDSKLLPKAVSPGIIHLAGPDDAITEYHVVHLAAVPEGAYGPRAIKWASCNGDALSCIPKLKSASYKERTNVCPLDCLSSLQQKSGSADINNMSMNSSSQPVTPGPQSFGNGTVETSNPNQSAPPTKPTIRIRRYKAESESEIPNSSEEEKPENNGGGGGEGETQAQSNDPNVDRSSPLYSKIQQLEKQVNDNTQRWNQREKQYQIEKIVPRELFVDSKQRFNQRAWEAEIQNAMKESASLEHLTRYYQLQLAVKQMPELTVPGASKRASSVKGASSQNYDDEDNERRMKLLELGKMIRGVR